MNQTNIVELTAKEHFVAHQLLVKMNPGHQKLAIAVVFMSRNAPTSRRYRWIRTAMANAMRGRPSPRKGIPHSPEHCAKISRAMRGNSNTLGQKRGPMSAEHKAKVGAAHRGKQVSPETRAKLSAVNMGNKYAIGNKNWLGRKHSPESKAKMTESARQREHQRHLRRLNGILAIPAT